jgi:hypothetical protein
LLPTDQTIWETGNQIMTFSVSFPQCDFNSWKLNFHPSQTFTGNCSNFSFDLAINFIEIKHW